MYQKLTSSGGVIRGRGILDSASPVSAKTTEMRSRYFRPSETLKFLIAASLGFSVHFFLDLFRMQPRCPACPVCPAATDSNDLLKPDLQVQLREPYKPKDMYDVIRYDYFNASQLLTNQDGWPIVDLLGHHKSDFKDILHQGMALVNSGKSRTWKLKKLINGYRRFDPLRGEEFVFDVELASEDPTGSSNLIEEVMHAASISLLQKKRFFFFSA